MRHYTVIIKEPNEYLRTVVTSNSAGQYILLDKPAMRSDVMDLARVARDCGYCTHVQVFCGREIGRLIAEF